MQSVQYLQSRGYSDIQIKCIQFTLCAHVDTIEAILFDGKEHRACLCYNKQVTKMHADKNPCDTPRQYTYIMRSIAQKARREKEPMLGYWSASPEDKISFKEMKYPLYAWEAWYIDVEFADGLK